MLFEAVTYDFGLADVCLRRIGMRITSREDIDASLVEFLAGKKLVQFGPWCRNSFAGPI